MPGSDAVDVVSACFEQSAIRTTRFMESVHYLTCVWPGLPELWWRGRLSALPVAIGFAIAVNFVLITRFLYPGWLPSGLTAMAFWVGIVAWGFLVVRSFRELPELVAPRQVSEEPDVFSAAQLAYLQGEWPQAERLLNTVLAIEHRDPPALLMLAAVYRHTGRIESAELLIDEIERLEAADPWFLEVKLEKQRLDRALACSQQTDSDRESKPSPETGSGDSNLSDSNSMAA